MDNPEDTRKLLVRVIQVLTRSLFSEVNTLKWTVARFAPHLVCPTRLGWAARSWNQRMKVLCHKLARALESWKSGAVFLCTRMKVPIVWSSFVNRLSAKTLRKLQQVPRNHENEFLLASLFVSLFFFSTEIVGSAVAKLPISALCFAQNAPWLAPVWMLSKNRGCSGAKETIPWRHQRFLTVKPITWSVTRLLMTSWTGSPPFESMLIILRQDLPWRWPHRSRCSVSKISRPYCHRYRNFYASAIDEETFTQSPGLF